MKFIIGYLIFSAIFIGWLYWADKNTPVSPYDGSGDVDYDEFARELQALNKDKDG